jgi:hypothetical protein
VAEFGNTCYSQSNNQLVLVSFANQAKENRAKEPRE